MENIQIYNFQIKSRYLKFKIFVTLNIFLIVLFDIGCCDIFTNIHATLLVFIVIIILIILIVQCCGNYFFNRIFFQNGLKSGACFSKAPETFQACKAIKQNLEPYDYRAVLFSYSFM